MALWHWASTGRAFGRRRAAAGLAVKLAAGAVLGGLAAGGASAATLNENCVVSVLNRSTYVQADGSWVLPNVPSNIGSVRARATCVEDGVTRSGQSEYFEVPLNGVVRVPEIVFDDPQPVPSMLTLSAPQTTLTAVGATVQLTATASYPGGSTADVTSSASGTNYTSSNPAVAPVSADGLVTALASGTVILTALNDGASGLLRVSVVLGGDTDGDGLPDDLELANGLNPNDPVDALEDFDRDGLTNRDELLTWGTDIRNGDTDGDTLPDGREVEVGTDPLVFDTDGDGVSDGLELATGSDPLDASSYNLAQALSSLEVSPPAVVLVVNSLIGEASRQLGVTGHLVDGTTLELTSRSRGTAYASSDLSVVSFGLVDGQIFAGNDGTATVTVSNAGFSAAVSVTVRSFSPRAVSFVPIPGYANNVDVAGDYAYVAAGSAGLQIVDVANRSQPFVAAALDTPGNANDVFLAGGLAYVADDAAGLQIVDVSDPLTPVLRASFDTPGVAWDVVVRGGRAYVADGASGLRIVDVTDPSNPLALGFLDTAGTAKGVDVEGGLAVVADGGTLRTIDVSNPGAPVLRGSLTMSDARDVDLDEGIAYVADFTGSLKLVNVANPASPSLLAATAPALGGILTDVVKLGRFTFGADVLFVNGVPITDVSLPSSPQVRARLDFPARDDNGTGIAADAQFVYLTADRGILENGVTGDTRLYIGQYLELTDEAGVPPSVQITAPPAGSQHVEGASVVVRAEASDDVGVAAVVFLVDGVPAFTDTVAPFEFTHGIPVGATSVTFGALAVDFGGNQGAAAPVTIVVIPDPGTTVSGRVVDLDGNPIAGASVSVFGDEFNGQSGADGRFSITGVPTVRGAIVVSARAVVDGREVTGRSDSVAPVPGGETDVGDVRVGQVSVLIVAADFSAPVAQLTASGLFSQVDVFNAVSATPTLATLAPYTVVLTYTNFVPASPTGLGNVLADYVDAGGGLALTTYAFSTPWAVQGRVTDYSPLVNVGQNGNVSGVLVAAAPGDPVFQGINLGGVTYFHNTNFAHPGLAPGAVLLATDGAGRNMIAKSGSRRVIGLNLFPGTCCGGNNQEFYRLLASALMSVR